MPIIFQRKKYQLADKLLHHVTAIGFDYRVGDHSAFFDILLSENKRV